MKWSTVPSTSKLMREPIVHFLIIGAAIFGLYRIQDDRAPPEPENRITVAAGDVERLRAAWSKQWQRPPTAAELKGLVDAYVREEVLYREALALGLDRDDTVIRRRLVQKFAFLTEDLSASRDPTKSELSAYFDANRDRYRVPPRLSFTQICFSRDRRGAAAERDASLALAGLRAGSTEGPVVRLGDSAMLDHFYRRLTARDIEAVFGRDFAQALFRLEPGVWSGPIVSGYGVHLVRVDERSGGQIPALGAVEARVRNDWSYDQRRQANDEIFKRLLARYEIVIEGGASGASAVTARGVDRGAAP